MKEDIRDNGQSVSEVKRKDSEYNTTRDVKAAIEKSMIAIAIGMVVYLFVMVLFLYYVNMIQDHSG